MKTLFRLLLAVALCSIARAQNINVQADATTGLLWRPSTLFSNATNGAAIYSGAGFPTQTGNSGKFLTTNGSALSWAVVSGSGTVTSVDVTTANGVSATGGPITSSGSFTFSLGAITPSSVSLQSSGVVLSGNALTLANSITSAAGSALVLATGTTGTAITVASATNLVTFSNEAQFANNKGIRFSNLAGLLSAGQLYMDTSDRLVFYSGGNPTAYFTANNNVLIGTTDETGLGVGGGIKTAIATEASSGAGSFITAGGIYAAKKIFTSTQLQSEVATGIAPLVVASTTKVDNLHVARATLSDTVTTNANLTGDVTSVGNATTLAAGSASNLNSGTLPAARMPALTGDITTSSGAVATTLATVNSNVGTFGSATAAATVTVNAKGLVTAASNTTVTPAVGSITGLGTNVGTFLATPSSANLAAAITDEIGTGPAQFANIVFNAQTGTSYEAVASDAGKWVTMSNAAANVFTVPDNNTVSYASGTSIIVEMRGAGATTVSPKNGNVTIQSRDSALALYGQYSVGVLTLHTVSGNATTWNFSGDIKP